MKEYNTENSVKLSISIPRGLRAWALSHARKNGHRNFSLVVQDGVRCLMQQALPLPPPDGAKDGRESATSKVGAVLAAISPALW